jgi:hypothetical protein
MGKSARLKNRDKIKIKKAERNLRKKSQKVRNILIDAIILYNKKSSIDSLKVDFKYDSVTVLYDEKDNLMFVISPQFATDTDLMAEMTDVIIPSLKNRSMLTGNVNMFILRNEEQLNTFNLTARNSPTSKVAGCKGFGLVQGLAPCT